MVRVTLFAACLSACVVSDAPSLEVSVDIRGMRITVTRAPNHPFGAVHATVNGVDAGTPEYDPGRDETIKAKPVGATAVFVIPPTQIASGLHLEIDDDGDRYTLDVPSFGSPRAPAVVSPLDMPLHPGDWVEVTTGIATDRIQSGVVAERALSDQDCFTPSAAEIGDGSTRFQVPPDLRREWSCDDPIPASGHPLPIKLWLGFHVRPEIMTCTGPSLTCELIDLFLSPVRVDATVEL
jgi:hypothetical protein